MIVSGAGLAHDIYGKLINTEATERQKLWANRIAVFVLGVIPFILALNSGLLGGLVQLIVVLQASMMGGMFFMPLVLGLHWKRANTLGGVAGMVGGFFTVLFWHIGTNIYSVVPESITAVVTDPVIPVSSSRSSSWSASRWRRASPRKGRLHRSSRRRLRLPMAARRWAMSSTVVLVYGTLILLSLTLGLYLLTTNPPKDESSFLGFGEEKLGDEELSEPDC